MAKHSDPLDGAGLGGMQFSWTATIFLDLYRYDVAPLQTNCIATALGNFAERISAHGID